MDEELKTLLKEQKEARLKLKLELEVKKELEKKNLKASNIFIHNLYNVKVDITFNDEFRGPGATKEELFKILKTFKPIDLFFNKSNSFRPTKDPKEEYIKVFPYLIKYDGFDGDVFLIWYSKLLKEMVEIKVKLSQNIAYELLNVTSQRQDFKGGFRIINTTLHLKPILDNGKFKYITWARGSEQYQNDFTIYSEFIGLDILSYFK